MSEQINEQTNRKRHENARRITRNRWCMHILLEVERRDVGSAGQGEPVQPQPSLYSNRSNRTERIFRLCLKEKHRTIWHNHYSETS